MAICAYCQGVGQVQGDYPPCYSCNGRGDNGMDRRVPCPSCRGSGKAATRQMTTCTMCYGKGRTADPPAPAPRPVNATRGGAKGTRAKAGTKKAGKSTLIDWIGAVLALLAAFGAVGYVGDRVADPPWVKVVAGGLAALLVYALRSVIVIGGVAVAILVAVLGGRGDEPSQTPTTGAGAVPLAEAAPRQRAFGVCVANDSGRQVEYVISYLDGDRAAPHRAAHGNVHVYRSITAKPDDMRDVMGIELVGHDVGYNLPVGEVHSIADEAMTCGTEGFPVYRIVQGEAGLEMR